MIEVRRYRPDDETAWDGLVRDSVNGTFLHTRRFLSYHGDRFSDVSMVALDGNKLLGVLPAAVDPSEPRRVISHPGLTYGGLAHGDALRGSDVIGVLELCAHQWRESGFTKLTYKAVPHIYHRLRAEDDLYALFRLGARISRVDLSATIDLQNRPRPNRNRRRNLENSRLSGIQVHEGAEYLGDFWPILQENLRERHQTQPTHSLEEIQLLSSRFPEAITCAVGTVGGRIVAGVVNFRTDSVLHPQYSAASAEGKECSALDALFEHGISSASEGGLRYFDFGISTEAAGTVLNEALYSYKISYGGGGVAHLFLDVDLEASVSTGPK